MSTTIAAVAGAAGGCLLLALLLRRRRRLRPPPPELSELDDAGIIVTGAGGGIGAALVRALAATGRPAVIVATCRRRRFRDDKPAAGSAVRQLHLDLSSLASVRLFVRRVGHHLGPTETPWGRPRLSHLVCNAGVFYPTEATSTDGLPSHAAVNFVGNVALIRWLLGNGVIEPGFTRVLLVSSSLSRRGVARPAEAVATRPASARAAYADSKQCLNLLAQHLHSNRGVNACAAFTGGPVATELLLPPWLPAPLRRPALWLMSLALKSPERVAHDLLGLMCRPRLAASGTSGRVFSAGRPVAWPTEVAPECLAEFVAGYERLVDSLAPDCTTTDTDEDDDG